MQPLKPGLRLAPHHRHKGHRQNLIDGHLAVIALTHQGQRLAVVGAADGDDHPAARHELFGQSFGDGFRGGGDDDGVERGVLGPALVAVAVSDSDVGVFQFFQALGRGFGQGFDNFNGIDVAGLQDLAQHGGLITRPGADF